jgi:predicted MPP superfamily phosphohydrolase
MINARNITIKNVELTSAKIHNNLNIIFISDVHLGTNTTKHLKKILNKIKTLKYDLIIIGGDLIDSSSFNINDLTILNEIKKDIYLVNGNHEYYLKNYKNKMSQLKNFNIRILKNTSKEIDQINLIGIDDIESKNSKIKYVTKLKKDNLFNLVISHKPDIWDDINKKVELMVSGHTHNGQIFPFNLIVKLKFKYIYGLYVKNKSRLYVSSGSGCWGPKLRIGSSNEIINIKLISENLILF